MNTNSQKIINKIKNVRDEIKQTALNGIQATDDLEEYTLFNNEGYIMMKEDQKF